MEPKLFLIAVYNFVEVIQAGSCGCDEEKWNQV